MSTDAPAVLDAGLPLTGRHLRPTGIAGLLAQFSTAGVLAASDVHVARRLGELAREREESVLLAVALTVRAVRLGSVCVDLRALREVLVDGVTVQELAWPDHDALVAALRRSPLITGAVQGTLTPLVLVDTDEGELLYLDRYFRQEQTIRHGLDDRDLSDPPFDEALLARGLAERFGAAPDRQRIAAALAVTRWTSVVTGGPGTGKTYTVARILQLLREQDPAARLALAAPTGKAAARLQEQVNAQGVDVEAVTLHRLLGWRPDSASRFRHDADNPLPVDVVVVDETSMVSLTMMARLMDALRPDCRLVLVGDPDQLASVDAGAVLADIVARPVPTSRAGSPSSGAGAPGAVQRLVAADLAAGDAAGQDPDETSLNEAERRRLTNGVVRLSRGRRFGGAIAELAVAVRAGDADSVLEVLQRGDAAVALVDPTELTGVRADVQACATAVTAAAEQGDLDGALLALERHRVLCAHRIGGSGVADWDRLCREWTGAPADLRLSYAGQPLLVTANDHEARIYNGDTGVVVRQVDGTLVAAFGRVGPPVLRRTGSLADVATAYAMTIHRSQGSQYDTVTVVLPAEESVLLTRDLLYTAVTRARAQVRVLGTEAAVRAAVARRVLRASGLRRVLIPASPAS